MQVNKILLNNSPQIQSKPVTTQAKPQENEYSYQTSIYNQKGVNVAFGRIAVGIDDVENACIKLLRKARNGRCRQYTEPQIMDSVLLMRGAKNDRNKEEVLQLIIDISEENNGLNPDPQFINNILKVTRDRGEREYYAVMNFAQNELEAYTVAPLEVLAKAPKEVQDKFVKLLSKIDDVDDTRNFKDLKARDEHINNLYDYARSVMYTYDDLPKLTSEDMLNNISDLDFDIARLKKSEGFASPEAQNAVVELAEELKHTMVDVVLNNWAKQRFQ